MNKESKPERKEQEGKQQFRAGKYAAAAASYRSAAAGYQEGGEGLKAAEMRSNQSVALLQAGDVEGAWEVVRGIDQIFAEEGDIQRQAVTLSNQAAVLDGLGRRTEAAERYRRAGDLFAECGEGEKRRQVMQALSSLQLKSWKPLSALSSMANGLEGLQNPTFFQRILKKILNIPFNV